MALYDARTNGERLMATGVVEMDSPCDCLPFHASLVSLLQVTIWAGMMHATLKCCTRLEQGRRTQDACMLALSEHASPYHGPQTYLQLSPQPLKDISAGVMRPRAGQSCHVCGYSTWLGLRVRGQGPSVCERL